MHWPPGIPAVTMTASRHTSKPKLEPLPFRGQWGASAVMSRHLHHHAPQGRISTASLEFPCLPVLRRPALESRTASQLPYGFSRQAHHGKIIRRIPSEEGLFKKYFLYLFLDRGEEREKERERNIIVWLPLVRPPLGTWTTTQECALSRNQASDPLVHRLALNPLSHTSQGRS